MRKNRVDRSERRTRGLQRIRNEDARNYICKEVQGDIVKAMREVAKDWFENIPNVDLHIEWKPIAEDK